MEEVKKMTISVELFDESGPRVVYVECGRSRVWGEGLCVVAVWRLTSTDFKK